jgi:hypothetical protein
MAPLPKRFHDFRTTELQTGGSLHRTIRKGGNDVRRLLILIAAIPLGGCSLSNLMNARPLDFACGRADLQTAIDGPDLSPLVDQIQADAGRDFDPRSRPPIKGGAFIGEIESIASEAGKPAPGSSADRLRSDPIYRALASNIAAGEEAMGTKGRGAAPSHILLLSGGGEWGAFGAGFLNALHKAGALPRFDVVTGVSTGAIQALFVATEDFEGLENQYTSGAALAKPGSKLGALRKGYLNDTEPLRERLETALTEKVSSPLCQEVGGCPRLEAIGASTTRIFIGMVETSTGDFKVADISRIARTATGGASEQRIDRMRRATQCILGVTMGSAAVPVQLRPVRLHDPKTGEYRTYTDGGVRLSVFEARIAAIAALFEKDSGHAVTLWVIRNGPTVVKPSKPADGGQLTKVDAKPSVDNVGLMSYSTLVNQNEIMSIAQLRLLHPEQPLFLATADGYASHLTWRRSEPCPKNSDAVFDNRFMKCLAAWGADKAQNRPGTPWISLRKLSEVIPPQKSNPPTGSHP